MKLIPKSIYQFVKVYDWQQQFPASAMPSFSSTSVRFVQAVNYYNSKMSEYREAMAKGK